MSTSAGEISIEINGSKAKLDKVLRSLETELKRASDAAGKAADEIGGKLGGGQDRAAKSALAHARAQATLKATTGDVRGAIETLNQALVGIDKNSTGAVRAQTQLARLQTQLTQSTGGLAGALKSGGANLLSFVGGLGLATTAITGLVAVAGRVKEGFDLRATLDEQRRSVGVFLQDVERGDAVFASAIAFGKQYGFTQAEMGQAAREAAPLIAQSTTSVEKQLEVLGRLASLNTREGISGATFSTKELASGDITSIVERFNLSRAAARGLKEEIANGADVFQVLDRYLASVGVTTDILSQRMQGAAGASRSYAQAQEGLNLALGQLAEGPGVAALDILTQMTAAVTGAFAAVPDAQAKAASLNETLFLGAASYAEYAAQAKAAQTEISASGLAVDALIPQIGNLTQAQFAYAQTLIATGTAAQAAYAAAQQQSADAQTLITLGQQLTQIDADRAAGLEQLGGAILQASSASEQDRENVFGLVEAYTQGQITTEAFGQALAQITAAHIEVANATALVVAEDAAMIAQMEGVTTSTTAASDAAQINTDKLIEQAAKTQEASAQSEALASFQATLANLGSAVANGHITAANGALQLAQAYGIATGEAQRLIAARAALGQAKANAAALSDQRAGERDGGTSRTNKQIAATKDRDRVDAAAARRYQDATETSAQKTARLRQEVAGLRVGSEAYYQAREKLTQVERQAAKGGGKGGKGGKGGGGGGGVDKAAKAAETGERKLTENTIAEQNKRADSLDKYEQQRLKISQDYAKKRLDAEREFADSIAQTNASFYDSLINMDNQGVAQAYDAQYQQVLSQLPQIAAEKGADVADAYLAAQESALQAQAGRASEIAKAEEEGNAGRAEALRGVDKLYRESEQRKIDAALNRTDSIAQAEGAAQAEASANYQENEAKIATANDRSTEKILRNTDAKIAALDKEAKAAGKTADQYERIAGTAPTRTSTAASGTATTPATAPDSGADGQLQGLAQVANRLDTVVERLVSVEIAVRDSGRDVANAARSRGGTGVS